MTDRVSTLTVVLERDIREDDVEIVVSAVKMIKYVASVDTNVVDVPEIMARQRVRDEIERKLIEAIITVCRGELPDHLRLEKKV